MSDELKIGHLGKANAAKINDIAVAQGQVIFSEGHNVLFVDYDGKRHTNGDIISGVFNDSYVDFNGEVTWDEILEAIKSNGGIPDGQRVSITNNFFTYRKIGDYHFLCIDQVNPGAVPFIINYGGSYNISHQTTVLLMDIPTKQLYNLTIDVAADGTLTTSCDSLSGKVTDVSSIMNVSLTGYLLQIVPVGSKVFNIISYSDSNIPSLSGFYSIIDDLA